MTLQAETSETQENPRVDSFHCYSVQLFADVVLLLVPNRHHPLRTWILLKKRAKASQQGAHIQLTMKLYIFWTHPMLIWQTRSIGATDQMWQKLMQANLHPQQRAIGMEQSVVRNM